MIREFCFMMIFERDIAIDLGTTNIRVFVRGKGIMLREPSIVAVDKYTGRMLKVGQDAQKMLGRTPANIVAIHPISAGVISDYDMTALMLKELLSRVTSFSLFKPRVLVTVPSSVTGVEERNVIDAVIEAGARKVYLVESAVATAAGAGADLSKPDGHLVIDIGGGSTEIIIGQGMNIRCSFSCQMGAVRLFQRIPIRDHGDLDTVEQIAADILADKLLDYPVLSMPGSWRGTGGMATKLLAAQIAVGAGCEMVIANGEKPELLYDIVAGKPIGTRFLVKR